MSRPRFLRVVLVCLIAALVVAPPAATRNPLAHAADSGGDQLWAAQYDGPVEYSQDFARSVGVSPDGLTVFVTGRSPGLETGDDFATVAYDATTGGSIWVRRYDGPSHASDQAVDLAVGSDGTRIFVTGHSTGAGTSDDYATVAYDAETGARLWAKRYDGPGGGSDEAESDAVSTDGTRVFVTGRSTGLTGAYDYATVAYDAQSGARLWARRYDGPGGGSDEAQSLAVSSDGSRVFVTGRSTGVTGFDYATVAYDAQSGARLWARRYIGGDATAVAVSGDGSMIFVTGAAGGAEDYLTVAYEASSGAEVWARNYNGLGNAQDRAESIAVTPDGSTVFVTGWSSGYENDVNYATLAYDSGTGSLSWAKRYGPPRSVALAFSVAVSPGGDRVFVTGYKGSTFTDYATVVYEAASGKNLWVGDYNGPGGIDDYAYAVAVSPDGSKVFVTGNCSGKSGNGNDYGTVAYQA